MQRVRLLFKSEDRIDFTATRKENGKLATWGRTDATGMMAMWSWVSRVKS
jgi:hypothetical protein